MHAVAERAREQAEGGRRLALAGAGMHDQDAALGVGGAMLAVDDGLLVRHALGMPCGVIGVFSVWFSWLHGRAQFLQADQEVGAGMDEVSSLRAR